MYPYRTFRRFDTEAEAANFIQFLMANGISATIENVPPILDRAIVGEAPGANVEVKVPADQFVAAQQLLRDNVKIDLDDIEPDYYLLSFTNKELLGIVHRPDEWGEYDQALAVALLRERGVEVTEEQVEAAEETRIEELAQPRQVSTAALAAIYGIGILGMMSIFFIFFEVMRGITPAWGLFAHLMVLTPIASGIAFLAGRRTLPDGRSAYLFDKRARLHGRIMIAGFLLVAILNGWMIFNIHTTL